MQRFQQRVRGPKASMLWFPGGALTGLPLTSHCGALRMCGPLIAVTLAAILVLPHVVWQIQKGWP